MSTSGTDAPALSAAPSWGARLARLRERAAVDGRVGAVWLILASLSAQAINIGNVLIQARFYSPDALGVFAIFLSVQFVVSTLSTLRYDGAVVVARTDGQGARVVLLTLAVITGATAILAALTAAAGLADRHLTVQAGPEPLILLPVLFAVSALIILGQQWCVRQKRLGRVAAGTVTAALSVLCAQTAFGLIGSPQGLIEGYVLGQGVAALVFAAPLNHAVTRALASLRRRPIGPAMVGLARRWRRFPMFGLPGSMVAYAFMQTTPLLIGGLLSPTAVGYFSMAYRATYTPFALLPSTLRQATYAALARAVQGTDGDVWRRHMNLILVWVGLVQSLACAFIFVVGPDLFSLLLGERWRAAGSVASIIAYGASAQALSTLFDRFFDLVGRQRTALLISLAATAATMAAVGGAALTTHALEPTALAWAGVSIVYAVVWILNANRVVGFGVRSVLSQLGLLVGINLAAIAIVEAGARLPISIAGTGQLPGALAGAAIGGVIGMAILWRPTRRALSHA